MLSAALWMPDSRQASPLVTRMTGSVDPADVRARMRTPQEVN